MDADQMIHQDALAELLHADAGTTLDHLRRLVVLGRRVELGVATMPRIVGSDIVRGGNAMLVYLNRPGDHMCECSRCDERREDGPHA